MRILLIAYEFPPGPSPQSLRWARLSRELIRHGADVRVLTVQRDGERIRLPAPEGLVIDRTPPGGASGLIAHLRSRHVVERTGGRSTLVNPDPGEAGAANDVTLNWKGRLVECANRLLGVFMFPNAFGQWEIGARLRLRQLLAEYHPDLVISSHEPATTLRLGRLAHDLGVSWLVDLGDPVLADYTPWRWRSRAHMLEAAVCRQADHITVTTEATRTLLVGRHGADATRISVMPQGYDRADDRAGAFPSTWAFEQGVLELVYTGSFYGFRNPRALVEAVLACDGVRLTIASRTLPDWLAEAAARQPEKLRLTGFVTHELAIALQRGADVLVDIGNEGMVQVPGKLFEYVGAERPILHIGEVGEGVAILQARRRMLAVPDQAAALVQALYELLAIKRKAAWAEHFDLRPGLFPEYEWSSIGSRLFELASGLASRSVGLVRRHSGREA